MSIVYKICNNLRITHANSRVSVRETRDQRTEQLARVGLEVVRALDAQAVDHVGGAAFGYQA